MRAPLSIVIPTLDAQAGLAPCLAALVEGVEAGLVRELVISDGGSADDTLAIVSAVGARVVSGPASRGGQLRRGAEAAEGTWLLFLHADTRLAPGWSDTVAPLLSGRGAYYGRLRFDDSSLPARIVAGWANLRSLVFALPYGDQGLLVHRALYAAAGGFDDVPLMEDVALARRLGRDLRAMDVTAVTSAAKYVEQGWLRRGGRNLWTLARYAAGADPAELARRYRR